MISFEEEELTLAAGNPPRQQTQAARPAAQYARPISRPSVEAARPKVAQPASQPTGTDAAAAYQALRRQASALHAQ